MQGTTKTIREKIDHLTNSVFPENDIAMYLTKEIEEIYNLLSQFQKVINENDKKVKHEVEI